MEANEQTELASKIETNSSIERRLTALGDVVMWWRYGVKRKND